MEPDTDTDSDDADIHDDEEYQTLIAGAGDAYSGQKSGNNCVKLTFVQLHRRHTRRRRFANR
eukprot:5466683-Prorocentrum_lima.AAC.1